MAADNLPLRDEKAGHGKLPETFAKVRILPKMYVKSCVKKMFLTHQKKKNTYATKYTKYTMTKLNCTGTYFIFDLLTKQNDK